MRTKLGGKFLRQALLVGSLGSLAIGLGSYGLLSQQARTISQQEILASSARAKSLVQFLPKELVSRSTDWGNWDESFTFVIGKNPKFAADYMGPKGVSDAGVDAITILRFDGTVAGQFLSHQSPAFGAEWGKIANDAELKSKVVSSQKPVAGYSMIDGRLYVIAAKLIQPTNDPTTSGGIILMGREITAGELSRTLQSRVSFGQFIGQSPKLHDGKATIELPLRQLISGNNPSIFLNVDLPATANAEIQQVVQSAWLVLLSILVAVAMVNILERLVTRRVVRLEKQMDELARLKFRGRLPEEDTGDEISSLVQKFNILIDSLARRNAEERKLRKEMQSALDIAVKSERTKSNFVAVTSHEIRTPLAAVLGGIELLQTKKLPPDIADIAQRLENSGERLRNIVDDVLDFSRIEHEGVSIDLQPVDLVEATGRIVDSYAAQAKGKGLELSFRPLFSPHELVLTDAFRIQQVLGNLISNALKFTTDGSVTVSLERVDDEHVRLSVADTGLGINSSQLENLFRPFAQADQSTVRRFGGTGLGLSICKRIVEAMGGEIGVSSKPGLGSTFWFQLALEEAPQGTQQNLPVVTSSAVPVAERSLSILVVEDNQMVQAIIQDQLALMGHRPTCVANGLAAFNAVSGSTFDAVLMDMHMPLMDGVAAAKAIRALGSPRGGLPIIALTADADQSRRRLYEDSGFHAFLTKPCSMSALAGALANIEPRTPTKKRSNVSPAIDPVLMSEIEQTMGKAALGRYLQQFIQQLDPAIEDILSHRGGESAAKVAEEAHNLKGAALSIGAMRMQKVLASLEVRARSGMNWQGLRAPLVEASSDIRIVLEAMNT